MPTLKYYVWLSRRVGAVTGGRALRHFGTPEAVFFAGESEYGKIEGITPSDARSLCKKELTTANNILARCTELGHRILTIQDAEYPERLRNIYDPPIVLYIKGRLPAIDEEAAVAIVGTRKSTPYGMKTAESCGYELARHGLLVVSGLARGADTAAALGALRGGGDIIGVLGCGIDVVYPAENARLYEDVAACGALISEYPPGTEPAASHFPVRNRIMSGISVGVAVIEAPLRSGALITASRALEQGRDVFTVPGNVDAAMSAGTNSLLRDGAIPLTAPIDIVTEYADLFPLKIRSGAVNKVSLDSGLEREMLAKQGLADNSTKKTVDKPEMSGYIDVEKVTISLAGAEKTIFEALRRLGGRAHIDDIIASSGLPASDALGSMTMLEIDGYAVSLPGGYYALPGL